MKLKFSILFLASLALLSFNIITPSDNNKTKYYCYKLEEGEIVINDVHYHDITELYISINRGSATGVFNWIPAEKDAMIGDFTGTVKGDIISAIYTFHQEGEYYSTPITIKFSTSKATVTGKEDGFGNFNSIP